MENNIVTLGVYFEIKDSETYGGEGTVGYANTNAELKISSLASVDVCLYVEQQQKAIAEMCHVDVEKVRVIPKTEYDANTEYEESYDFDLLD